MKSDPREKKFRLRICLTKKEKKHLNEAVKRSRQNTRDPSFHTPFGRTSQPA